MSGCIDMNLQDSCAACWPRPPDLAKVLSILEKLAQDLEPSGTHSYGDLRHEGWVDGRQESAAFVRDVVSQLQGIDPTGVAAGGVPLRCGSEPDPGGLSAAQGALAQALTESWWDAAALARVAVRAYLDASHSASGCDRGGSSR